MGKIVAWLILIVIVLLALRVINMRKASARRRSERAKNAGAAQPMVRCAKCGVFLPRAEARSVAGGFSCPEGQCIEHR